MTLKKMIRSAVILVWALVLVGRAATVTWTNTAGGSWSVAANWSPNKVPDQEDRVIISAPGGFEVTLNANTSIKSLTLGDGTGQQTLSWSGGGLLASGGSVTVLPGAVLNLIGGERRDLYGPLTNAGTVNVTGAGSIGVYNDDGVNGSGRIENLAGALFSFQGNQSVAGFAGKESFNNAGIVRKSGSTGVTSLAIPFNNTGVLDVQSGTVLLGKGGVLAGSAAVAAGAALTFASDGLVINGFTAVGEPGSQFNFSSGTITGEAVRLLGARFGIVCSGSTATASVEGPLPTLTVTSGQFTCNATVTNVAFSGGGLHGLLTVKGTMDWANGVAYGSVTIAEGATLNLVGTEGKDLYGPLTNAGTVNVTGAGPIGVYNDSGVNGIGRIDNLAGALFSFQGNQAVTGFAGKESFNNAGIVRKSGSTGVTSLAIPFNNTGVLDVQSGTVLLGKGGVLAGSAAVAAGAALTFASDGLVINGFTAVGEPGSQFNFSSGTITGGAVRLLGARFGIVCSGSTATASVEVPLPTLTVSGGQFTCNATATNVAFSGGGLHGSLTVKGTMDWATGVAYGPLTISEGATLNLVGAERKDLYGPLTNAGTVSVTGAGPIGVFNDDGVNGTGRIENLAGALFSFLGNQSVTGLAGRESFNNAGIVRLSGIEGDASLEIPFHNAGVLDVESGTVDLVRETVLTGGSLRFGLSSASVFGRVSFQGSVALGGTVGAHLQGGFVPAVNDTFPVVTYESASSLFTSTDLPAAAFWQTNYAAQRFSLTATGINPAVTFDMQPRSQSLSLGAALSIDVSVTSPSSVSYQWLKDGESLAGATQVPYAVQGVGLAHAGVYRVVASNAFGSVTSAPAVIKIYWPAGFARQSGGGLVDGPSASSGCAMGDYDGDGYADLFVTSWSAWNNTLMHNNRDGTFAPRPLDMGANSYGAAWGDFDNDGKPDLFVARLGAASDFLFLNNGDGSFTRNDTGFPTDPGANPGAGVWGDYDRDGWLDLFVTGGWRNPVLYHNDHNRNVTRVTNSGLDALGIWEDCSWADVDNDGWPDLFVASYSENNRLYRNNRDGSFTSITNGPVVSEGGTSWTGVWGDYDNDGYLDLFVVNDGRAGALYHNDHNWSFTRVPDLAIASDAQGWGTAAWIDANADGWLDLLVAGTSPAVLYRNNRDGTFTREALGQQVGDAEWTTALALADIDRDGLQDVIFNKHYAPSFVLMGRTNGASWLQVRCLTGSPGRDAIGAKVKASAAIDGAWVEQTREVTAGTGFRFSTMPEVWFGLGTATNVSLLRVEWPSGLVQEWRNLAPGQALELREPVVRLDRSALALAEGAPGALFVIPGTNQYAYQWLREGVEMPGKTNAILGFVGAALGDAGSYEVRISRSNQTTFLKARLSVVSRVSDGLIGDYRLDGDAADRSPNSNHGAVHGGQPAADRFGAAGGAVHFNGAGDYVEIPSSAGWTFPSGDLTMSLWIRAEQLPGELLYHGDGGTLGNDQMNLGIGDPSANPNMGWYVIGGEGVREVTGRGEFSAGRWFQLVVRKGDGRLQMFVDGQRLPGSTAMASGPAASSMPVTLGGRIVSNAQSWFAGSLDDFKVWGRALSDAEVDAVYNRESTRWLAITGQPQGGVFPVGGTVVLAAPATGVGTLSHQWFHDGRVLPGETGPTLVITNLSTAMSGLYSAVVSNLLGSVASEPAVVVAATSFTRLTNSVIESTATHGIELNGWADYDADGYPDLVITRRFGGNGLFHNERNGTFSIVTSGPIPAEQDVDGGSWGDIDNDGLPDLVLMHGGDSDRADVLFHNEGGGVFTRISLGETGEYYATWVDVDRDGWQDLYTAAWPSQGDDHLFHNNHGELVGPASILDGMAAGTPAFADFNNDGAPDLFLPGCGDGPCQFYVNDGQGNLIRTNFAPLTTAYFPAYAGVWGDYDNDGRSDIYIGGHNSPGVLFHNDGTNFSHAADSPLTTDAVGPRWATWADYDNDGWLDLIGTTGAVVVHRNNGDGTFTPLTGIGIGDFPNEYGKPALADFDRDGFLDLSVGGAPNRVYRNVGNQNGWLHLRLVGKSSNRLAYGAKVRVRANLRGTDVWQLREINGGNGSSQNYLEASFGLGDAAKADIVSIEWPSGAATEFRDVMARQFLTILEEGQVVTAVEGFGSVRVQPPGPYHLVGQPIELTAQPARWHRFLQWSDGNTDNPRTIALGVTNNYTAIFTNAVPLEEVVSGGRTNLIPVGMPRVYLNGEYVSQGLVEFLTTRAVEVRLESSVPNSQIFYTLDGSVPDIGGSLYEGPFTIAPSLAPLVISTIAYDEIFNEFPGDPLTVQARALRFITTPLGQGSIQLQPAGPYLSNTVVTATATAAPGWAFDRWEGDLAGSSASSSINLTHDSSARAVFLPLYTLNTRVVGGGDIVLQPGAGSYKSNSIVTLTAQASSGWAFDHWEGASSGTNTATSCVMTGPLDVTAVFIRTYALTLSTPGGGVVSMQPAGDPALFRSNAVVTLTAAPGPGWTFLGWTGDVDGTEATNLVMNLPMTRQRAVRGIFGTTLTAAVNASGVIQKDPVGPLHPYGARVRLTAVPNAGKYFNNWAGAAIGQSVSPLDFAVTSPTQTVSAVFGTLPASSVYSLTIFINGGGSVTRTPQFARYTNGAGNVTLTAVADTNWFFRGWSGDVQGTNNPASLPMSTNRVVTATFAAPPMITQQPVGQVLPVGSSLQLGVSATGSSPMAFQWLRNGQPVPGANQQTLTLSNLQFATIGDYSVVITNLGGSITSDVARVTLPGVEAPAAAEGLIAWWPGDGDSLDRAGTNHGVASQGVSFAAGNVGGAFALNGVDGFVDLGASDRFNFEGGNGDLSIEAWIRPEGSVATGAGIVAKATYPPYTGWGFYLHGDGSPGFGGVGVWEVTPIAGSAPLGAWSHVAVTKRGPQYLLYLNGVEVGATTAGPLENSSTALRIGTSFEGSNRFHGLIDEVAIFNRALDPGELRGHYLAGTNGYFASPSTIAMFPLPHPVRPSAAGRVVVWGGNTAGIQNLPSGLTNAVAISGSSGNHALALRSDGTVTAWGSNTQGQTSVPAGLAGVVAVDAGHEFSLALKDDATVVGWGFPGRAAVPPGLTNVVAIAAGHLHSLALRNDGTVVGWGQDSWGETSPPPAASNVVAIAAGYGISGALRADGTVVAWGRGEYGETNIPAGLAGVTGLAAGSFTLGALRGSNPPVLWGDAGYGTTNTQPAQLAGLKAISLGTFGIGLRTNGTLVTWGAAGQPTNAPAGLANVVAISAGNENGFAITLDAPVNQPPTATPQTVNTAEDTPVSITLSGVDPEGVALGFTIVNPPASGTLEGVAPNLVYRPATNASGQVTFAFNVSDGPNTSVAASVTINISPVNDAPVLPAQAGRTPAELTPLVVTNAAIDVDLPANTLSYRLDGAPAGATIDASGVIRWTPSEAQGPSTNVFVTVVTDSGTPSLSSTNAFTVVVTEVNTAPNLAAVADQSTGTGATLRVVLSAVDADLPGNHLSFTLVSGPAGMVVGNSSGEVTWLVPGAAAASTNNVVVRVTDDGVPALSADRSFRVIVSANAAPTVDIVADRVIDEMMLASLVVTAHDADGPASALTFALDPGAPAGMAIDGATGELTWTPSEAQGPSTNQVTVRVTDAGTPPASGSASFKVVVREVNTAPTLDPVPAQVVDPLSTLRVTMHSQDADLPGNTLRYSLVSGPQGAVMDPVSGVFTWTPTAQQAGSTVVAIVEVSDNGTPPMGATQVFGIRVTGCDPGAMRILVDGTCYGPGAQLTVTNHALLRIESVFTQSLVFYTLDGQVPGGSSPEFTSDLTLVSNVVIRARAFDLQSGDMQEAGPVFVEVAHAYYLSTLLSGGGAIGVSPVLTPSTNAGGVRYGPYAGGASVQLTAQPTQGWSFMRWGRSASAGGASSTWPLVMSADAEVEAVFGTRVILTNLANGAVRLDPAAELFPYATTVRLTAEPAAGFYHRSWVGVGIPTTPMPLDLVLTNPEPKISALFLPLAANQVTLSVWADGPGTVMVEPLLNLYTNGQVVTVTAVTASPANPFLGWSGLTNSGSAQMSVRLTGSQTNYTLVARFSTNALPFWFEPSGYAASESNGVVVLTIRRGTNAPALASYRTVPGSAIEVDENGWGDYWRTNGTVAFAPGTTASTLSVLLRDNRSYQSNRVFSVELYDPAATNTALASAAVTVVEDDAPPTDCSVFERKVDGGQTTNATLRVVLLPGTAAMKWRLGYEHTWRSSGDSVNLVAGDYDLRFKPVAGYEPPGWETNVLSLHYIRVQAGLNQLTNSYTSIAARDMPNGIDVLVYPAEVRSAAQWRLVGETAWWSGERTNVALGEHLIEFSPLAGYVQPLPQTVVVGPAGVQAIAVEYTAASTESVLAHSTVELALADNSRNPYRFVGQIVGRKDSYGSGTAVRERVVLTAAHVVYDNKALADRSGVRWLHMGQGTGRDASLQPRGWVLWTAYSEQTGATVSYTNQVAQEPVRGLASLRTRDMDVAALYFLVPAARGWYSGYLVSGPTLCATNSWLETSNSKLLVGFPNVGQGFGRMMEFGPRTNGLSRMTNADYAGVRVYGATTLASFGGNSGAALCVDAGNGVYYPAGVYLGVTDGKGIYAAIDSAAVAAVIRQADYLADTGRSHDGNGGPIEAPLEFIGGLGALTVQLGPPGAVTGGARWSLVGLGGPYTNTQTVPFLPPGNYQVSFSSVPGYRTPTNFVVSVWPDQTVPLTVLYEAAVVTPAGVGGWLLDNGRLELTVTGSVGARWVLEASTNLSDPARYGFRPVQTNTLDASGRWIFRDTNAARVPERYFRLKQ